MKQRKYRSDGEVKTKVISSLDMKRWFPPRGEDRDFNKGTFGEAVIIAGSLSFAGAAVLSANAAMRSGVGYVTLVVPEKARASVESRLYPSIVLKTSPDRGRGFFTSSVVDQALRLSSEAMAVALGPGIGTEAQTGAMVKKFLLQYQGPLVLDADALNLLAREPDHGRSLILQRQAPTILTPHPGEMARLMGLKSEQVQKSREKMARKCAQDYQCIVVLKGSKTLIVDKDGFCYQNPTGNSGMATAGSGDVLTGLVAGLLAQGHAPFHAAVGGVFIHGQAGDLIALKNGGVIGMTAHDLIEALPAARAGQLSIKLDC